MILYSIVPADIVFKGFNTDEKADISYVELEYQGERVQAVPVSNSEYIIARLISTYPKAYLKPGLQPGTIIKI